MGSKLYTHIHSHAVTHTHSHKVVCTVEAAVQYFELGFNLTNIALCAVVISEHKKVTILQRTIINHTDAFYWGEFNTQTPQPSHKKQ